MKIFTHVLLALRAVRPVAAGIARALREDPQTFTFGRARGQAFTWATHCSGVWAVMHFPPPARRSAGDPRGEPGRAADRGALEVGDPPDRAGLA
ncbi:MAG: hypothetical protein V4793_15940 [Paraburkholderia tropica]